MNEGKWNEIHDMIVDKFEVAEDEKTREEGERVEWIVFDGPSGKMKVEWTERPRTLDVKTQYSRRAGTSASVVGKVTSDTEKVNFLKAFVWKDDEWVEMDTGALGVSGKE